MTSTCILESSVTFEVLLVSDVQMIQVIVVVVNQARLQLNRRLQITQQLQLEQNVLHTYISPGDFRNC